MGCRWGKERKCFLYQTLMIFMEQNHLLAQLNWRMKNAFHSRKFDWNDSRFKFGRLVGWYSNWKHFKNVTLVRYLFIIQIFMSLFGRFSINTQSRTCSNNCKWSAVFSLLIWCQGSSLNIIRSLNIRLRWKRMKVNKHLSNIEHSVNGRINNCDNNKSELHYGWFSLVFRQRIFGIILDICLIYLIDKMYENVRLTTPIWLQQ